MDYQDETQWEKVAKPGALNYDNLDENFELYCFTIPKNLVSLFLYTCL